MSLPGTLVSVDFQRPTYTADAYGGQVPSFAALYSAVQGSLQPAKGRLVTEFAKIGMQITHSFYTEQSIVLKAGDRMVYSSANYIVVSFGDMAGQGSKFVAHLLKKD